MHSFFLATNSICVRTDTQTGTCSLGRTHSAYVFILMGKIIEYARIRPALNSAIHLHTRKRT